MLVDAAEPLGKGELLLWCHILIAKLNHLMVKQRLMHIVKGLIVERLRQVDARDFGAECAGKRRCFEGFVCHM